MRNPQVEKSMAKDEGQAKRPTPGTVTQQRLASRDDPGAGTILNHNAG
jgi:hypothetical protein